MLLDGSKLAEEKGNIVGANLRCKGCAHGGVRRKADLSALERCSAPGFENTAEVTTLKPVIEKIVQRFPVKRVIAVADRGLLSTDNLAELQAITLPGGGVLEFILAVPGRRYADFAELLAPLHAAQCADAKQEVLGETTWNDLRLIIAHDPHVAAEADGKRNALIESLEQKAAEWAVKLDGQDNGTRKRGRKLSDGGARARFYRCARHGALRVSATWLVVVTNQVTRR